MSRISNYSVQSSLHVHINEHHALSKRLDDINQHIFDIIDVNTVFNQNLKLIISDKKYEISKHIMIIKTASGHERRIIHDMKDFSLKEMK